MPYRLEPLPELNQSTLRSHTDQVASPAEAFDPRAIDPKTLAALEEDNWLAYLSGGLPPFLMKEG